MDRRVYAAVIVLVVASAAAYLWWSGGSEESNQGVASGKRAVNIVIDGLNNTSFDLRSHRGEVVVIEFITTWCRTCMIQTKVLKRFQEEFSGVVIASIDVDVDLNLWALEEWAAEMGTRWFVGHSPEAGRTYGVYFLPTVIVIDGKGNIRYRGNYTPFDELRLVVQQIQ